MALGTVAAGAAIAVVVLVGDDDSTDDASGESTTVTTLTASDDTTPLPETVTFELAEVPFTFDYPGSFAAADTLPTGYLAILGIDPINFIDVRLTADEELTDDDIVDEIGAALETDTTDVLGQSTRTVDGVVIISFEVADHSAEETTNSRLHFVRAGGRTWELGCQSNDAGADVIDDACDQVLETFALTE